MLPVLREHITADEVVTGAVIQHYVKGINYLIHNPDSGGNDVMDGIKGLYWALSVINIRIVIYMLRSDIFVSSLIHPACINDLLEFTLLDYLRFLVPCEHVLMSSQEVCTGLQLLVVN